MAVFLGVDGGGTGCRAAVADAAGRILGRGAAGPANIATDPETAAVNIRAAAEAALAEAGVAVPDGIGMGLAGANAEGVSDRLRAVLPWAGARIETDAIAGVKGALGAEDGVVAAMGTGSVFGEQRSGRIRQIGGWGPVLGDEGSGRWIGQAILAAALRAHDGHARMTPLLTQLVAEHGSPSRLVSWAFTARPTDFAALAQRVIASGDPAAAPVLDRAVAETAEFIALLQRLGEVPVVFLGGLAEFYAARLAGRWQIRPPRGSVLDGALMLAREARG